jgi:hypothetical protein
VYRFKVSNTSRYRGVIDPNFAVLLHLGDGVLSFMEVERLAMSSLLPVQPLPSELFTSGRGAAVSCGLICEQAVGKTRVRGCWK